MPKVKEIQPTVTNGVTPNLYKCSVAPIYVNFHIYDETGGNTHYLLFQSLYIRVTHIAMYLTITDIKQQLNLDPDYHDDDRYLLSLIETAEDAITKRIDRKLSHCVQPDGMLPPTIIHAIKLLVATWYANRETFVTTSANELPQGFEYLANLNKHYEMF